MCIAFHSVLFSFSWFPPYTLYTCAKRVYKLYIAYLIANYEKFPTTPFLNFSYSLSLSLFFLAPAGFPQNLTALTLTSTAISISWNKVLVDETNGIITQYNVTAVPDESFADVAEILVNNSTFSVVFNGLEEFIVYWFTISARTVVGFGPTSPEVSARTSEAGKHGLCFECEISTYASIHVCI